MKDVNYYYRSAIESLDYLNDECEYYYRDEAIKDVRDALKALYLLAGGEENV